MKRYSIIVPFGVLLLFLIATLPAQSQSVIMSGDYFLTHNAEGTQLNTTATKAFNPATCLWVFVQDNDIRTADSNGNAINSNNNYLQYTSLALGTDWGNWYRARNGEKIYHRTGNNNNNRRYHYPQLNNTTWGLAYNQTNQNNNTTYLYSCSKTPHNEEDNITDPTISISSFSGNTITFTHTDLGGTYTYAYTTYTINTNKIHNWYNNTDNGTDTPTVNASDLDPQYTWSITTGSEYASITQDGELTISAGATGTITVNLAITGISPLNNKDITYTITAENVPQLKEAESEDMFITPSECTLDLGESFTFQAPSSVANVTTYTRNAYTSITTIDATLYLVNGRLETEQPSIYTEHLYDVPFSYFRWSIQQTGGYYVAIDDNCYYNAESNLGIVHRQEQLSSIPTTATLTVTGEYGGATLTAQATINIPPTYVDIDGVSCGGLNLVYGQSGTLTPNTWTSQNGAKYVELRYSSDNENVATVTQDGVVTATGTGQVNITIQSVRRDGTTQGAPSCVVYLWINKATLAAPTIDISPNGQVTITDNNDPSTGATIYYTTDGRLPAYSETRQEWNGNSFTVPNMTTVMAVAIANDNYNNSAVSSKQHLTTGIDATAKTIYFNDFEDHTWTYYSGKPDDDYPNNLTSPDPRNVVITYNGGWVNGGSDVAVSATENVNKFVYYKTIEKKAWGQDEGRWLTGNYAYQVIPNPFSKRPAVTNGNTKTYYGFGGWKITSGGEYISGYDNNQVLPLDKIINFTNLDNNYTPNCISAQIVLEATWVAASVITTNANITGNLNGMNGANYETNFIVYTDGGTHTVSGLTKGATISNNYPDGTPAGSATISSFTTNTADAKLEYIKIGDGNTPVHPIDPTTNSSTGIGSGTFTAGGENWLIVGRGCTGTVNYVCSSGNGGKYNFRIESGKYQYMTPLTGSSASNSASNYARIVLGCDYDRAADDGYDGNGTGDNTKLRIVNYISRTASGAYGSGASEIVDIIVKSGYYGFSANTDLYTNNQSADGYGLGIGGNTDGYGGTYTTKGPDNNNFTYNLNGSQVNNHTWERNMSFYVGPTRQGGKEGVGRILIEGGEFCNINGGGANPGSQDAIGFHLRMKGGWVKGAIYGTASISNSTGSRKLVFTGGEINGWVAGGCNGTDFGNGQGYNQGTCFIYAGGNAEFRSHDGQGTYNNAYGLVFNVPGGQIFGAGRGLAPDPGDNTANRRYCGSTTTAYVVVADESLIEQNVYGGGYNGVSQTSHVYVTGGTVGKNVFGGTAKAISTDGTWRSNNTDIRMYGGTVLGGIYGGHDETGIQYQDASVRIIGGTIGSDLTKANVHGGGLGNQTEVQGNVSVEIGLEPTGNDKTLNKEFIDDLTAYADFYGGSALGKTATTANKSQTVKMYSGTVIGDIYGGALGNPSTEATVGATTMTVDIYGGRVTGSVYGGSNINTSMTRNYAIGVTIHDTYTPQGGSYAISRVFGGGNGEIPANNGEPGANHNNQTFVNLTGGSVERAFGGGNASTAQSTLVNVSGGTHGYVFGGGNLADVLQGVTVNVTGGSIQQDVYGGGALANTNTQSGTTTVNLTGGEVYNVFGGGLGDEDHYAQVGGNVQVLLNQGVPDNAQGCVVDNAIFGCNNVNGTPLGTVTVHVFATQKKHYSSILLKPDKNQDKTLNQGDHDIKAVYGGGNMAAYRPTQANTPTHVIIDGCGKTSIEYVYGGGNAAPVPATQVDINGSYQLANVFGGGNGKDALPNGDPNPGADVGIYEVDQTTWNSAGNLQYTDPGNEKGDKKYILYGNPNAVGSVIGTTQVYILGGVVSQVFGGSNTKGDIVKEAKVILGDEDLAYCEFSIGGVYGGSNEAYMSGSAAIDMHCIEGMDEIYGGSKKADISKDVVLTINGGRYGKVFGGNNISGRINGSITINIEQTGCLPIVIDELYGGGNQAPYSIYGYDGTEIGEDGIERPVPRRTPQQGVTPHHDPVINIVSCESIGTVYGGGFKALMVGSPEININMVRGWVNGRYDAVNNQDPNRQYENAQNLDHLGTIGTVYGGGNQAEVVGSTNVNIGTESDVQVHDVTKAVYDVIKTGRTDITNPNYTGGADQTKDLTITVEGANITNNIYGGGNNAAVTGQTFITVGPAQ